MKKRIKNTLLGVLSVGLMLSATVGVATGIPVSADSVRVKPTGLNENTLTAEIKDTMLDTFKVYGASTRTAEPVGFRFLTTIEQSDLELIPNDAEFGTLILPYNKLGENELTKDTENALVAPALVDTGAEAVPANGLGYYITLMGETLEDAFPENLYNSVLAARSYVKYTYTVDGEEITDYAYSATTIYRSIAYVASCELVEKQKAGEDVSNSSYLNAIISQTTESASLSIPAEMTVGSTKKITLENATDGVNQFAYILTSSNEEVAVINNNGEVEAVGAGTATITAKIGTKEVSTQITVTSTEFTAGNILYSTADGKIFMPDGLLDGENETIVSAVGTEDSVDYFDNGKWNALALTETEITANAVRETNLSIKTSDGDFYTVNALSYAGVIDELSDFPAFFNNTAIPSEFDSTKTAVAPNVYGYYIVTKNLGTGSEELAFTQTEATDYNAANGFNGVLDGQGHKLQFTLTSGGLVGMILGNATIKNLAVSFTDNTSGHYGVFGYRAGGHTVIENCYIERVNNPYTRTTIYGIIACTNKKLELRNTVVHGGTMSNAADWYSNMYISESSTNAFLIYARLDQNANTWGISANFTEIVDGGVLASDLSSMDTNYWNTADNRISWKGLANMSVSVYEEKYVQSVDEKAMYSTISNEIFLPTVIGSDMSEVVSITSADESIVYYENGAWTRSFALTTDEINANATRSTTVIVETSMGYYYELTVVSYAGVIDELSDFPAFFNNTAVPSEFDSTKTAVAPNVYGYYIVTKNLGTGSEELAFTQTEATDYNAANGFNGVLDGQGHKLQFTLTSGGLVGMILGNATIKNLAVSFTDNTSGHYGVFGYRAGGHTVIENCYIERVNNPYTRTTIYGIIACTNKKLELRNTVVHGGTMSNAADWYSNMYISESSTNAFLIYARLDQNANTWGISANFTEIVDGGVLASDLSSMDTNYWNTADNRISWKGLADMAVNCIGELVVQAKNLAENGETQYAIVLPTNADATLTLAKDELVSFFAEATGATLSVVSDIAYDTYGAYISIGDTQTFANSGVEMGEMNSQGYHLQTVNNTIYINANSSVGCLYGVYGLLGELFGYEQYSEDTYALNTLSLVELPALNKTESPDIAMRMRSNGALINNTEYANRMGMAMGELDYLYRVGDYTNNGGAGWTVWHNAFEILPPSYWKGQGKTNWFSDDGTQLCYTAHGNTDDYNAMVAQIAAIMQQTLESSQITNYPDAVYYTLTSEDTETSCTCSACQSAKATYGSNAGAVIKLCNDVQATVAEWMNNNTAYKRDITLLFFAYNAYVDAPTAGTIEMREDVGVMYAVSNYVNYYYDINADENASFRKQFDAWADLAAINDSDFTIWTYTKNFKMYMLRADVYGENAFFNKNAYQYFANAGVDFWFNQGAANGTSTLSTFEKLNGYIDSQMMWDSTQSVTTLTNNWFTAMYGAGAESMKSLYTAQNAKAREVYGTTKLGIPSVEFEKSNAKEILTEDVLNTWFGYIDSAKSAVNADANLTDTEKAKMIEHINEEWISVKFLYIYLYYSSIADGLDGVTIDVDAAKEEFRTVLGYDSSTGTYAKDVVLLERAGCTLVEFIESDFTTSV